MFRGLLARRKQLFGHIDVADHIGVAGWAAYAEGIAPTLTIKVNGATILQFTPDQTRHDLTHLFPQNTRLGFNYRFPQPLKEHATISVVDEQKRHLVGSPHRVTIPQTEWLNRAKRLGFAMHYLNGKGLEIGALHFPLPLPTNARARYVDRLPREELYKQYPELADYHIVEPDVIADGQLLDGIEDESEDFIIANHFIEHAEDPILALKNFLRVLRHNGVIFLTVPDKRNTFDKDRPTTAFEHLVKDHEVGAAHSRNDHFVEWVRLKEKIDETSLPERVRELKRINYSIHFHVWDPFSFLHFLFCCRERYRLPMELIISAADADEFFVLLRKRPYPT